MHIISKPSLVALFNANISDQFSNYKLGNLSNKYLLLYLFLMITLMV